MPAGCPLRGPPGPRIKKDGEALFQLCRTVFFCCHILFIGVTLKQDVIRLYFLI